MTELIEVRVPVTLLFQIPDRLSPDRLHALVQQMFRHGTVGESMDAAYEQLDPPSSMAAIADGNDHEGEVVGYAGFEMGFERPIVVIKTGDFEVPTDPMKVLIVDVPHCAQDLAYSLWLHAELGEIGTDVAKGLQRDIEQLWADEWEHAASRARIRRIVDAWDADPSSVTLDDEAIDALRVALADGAGSLGQGDQTTT